MRLLHAFRNKALGDSYGVELVSKVLQESKDVWATMEAACRVLKGRLCDHHGAANLRSTRSSKASRRRFRPPHSLQHLYYILFISEAKIDELHPRYRRATKPVATSMSECAFATNLRCLRKDDFATARWRFMVSADPGILKLIMGSGKATSSILLTSEARKTMNREHSSFAQHEGVLRGEMVKHWVFILHGPCATGESYGAQSRDVGTGSSRYVDGTIQGSMPPIPL